MLRECQSYYSELKACESFKGRFYQFYIDGHQGDKEAASRIIDREKDRIKERLRGHYENNVWEKRTSPPPKEEWSKPLPQYMLDKQENSYLYMYAQLQEKKDSASASELKMMEVNSKMINSAPTCTIL